MSSRFIFPTIGLTLAALICGGLGCTPTATSPTKKVDTTPISITNDSANTQVATIKPMDGFKVYQNNKEAFAMQYPESWTIRENSFNTIVSFLSPITSKDDKFAENVNVVSETIADKTVTLDDYYKVSEENLKKFFADFKLLKNEATTLSGVPARMVVYTASQNQLKLRTTQIFTIKNGKAYIVTLTNTQSDPNQYMTEMLKISQSFQFLP